MSRPPRVLPDRYNPWSDKQRNLRAAARRAKRDGDDPTSEERDAALNFQAWRKLNPNAVDPARTDTAPSTVTPKPAPPTISTPAPKPVDAAHVATLPEHFRPAAVDDVAHSIGDPSFALQEPPIGDEAPATPKPDPLDQLQRQLDQARLDLFNEQTANRRSEAHLRTEIAATKAELRAVIFTRDGRDLELDQAQQQLALADETIRRQERELGDLRAYTALAAVPVMPVGTWVKAYIVDPNPTPAPAEAITELVAHRGSTLNGRRTPRWYRRDAR